MGEMMELKQLQIFSLVAEEGTISAAAKKLHMAQPPVSLQMKALEEELGVTLFLRGARHITLTPAGQLLYQRTRQILSLSRSTWQEVSAMQGKPRGLLRLGTVSSSGALVLPQRMQAFHRQFPDVCFEVQEGNTFELLDLLRRDLIEIAIVRTPFATEGLACRYLPAEPMIAAALPALVKEFPNPMPIAALQEKPLVVYTRFEALVQSTCQAAGFEPRVLCKTQDARTSLLWADAGMGIALVPKSALQMIPGRLLARELDCTALNTQIAAVAKQSAVLSEAAKKFLCVFESA